MWLKLDHNYDVYLERKSFDLLRKYFDDIDGGIKVSFFFGGGGQQTLVLLLFLGPPFFPIILFLSTALSTGMTGISLHMQWPVTSQSHGPIWSS
jgi:hypothetical protein